VERLLRGEFSKRRFDSVTTEACKIETIEQRTRPSIAKCKQGSYGKRLP
jgi:hypothetical protein